MARGNIEPNDLEDFTEIREMPLTHDLVDIELKGIALDLEWCKTLEASLKEDLEKIKQS